MCVPIQLAEMLKQKGFNEKCLFFYPFDSDKPIYGESKPNGFDYNNEETTLSAPMYHQATEWIRKNHQLELWLKTECSANEVFGYIGCIHRIMATETPFILVNEDLDPKLTVEEVFDKTIEKALNLITR